MPEGGAAEGEDRLEAARRELQEETGYRAAHWQEILRAHLSNSVSDEEAFCYLATGLSAGQAEPEGTERLQVKWVLFSEALGMIDRGEITDALTILALASRLQLLSGTWALAAGAVLYAIAVRGAEPPRTARGSL